MSTNEQTYDVAKDVCKVILGILAKEDGVVLNFGSESPKKVFEELDKLLPDGWKDWMFKVANVLQVNGFLQKSGSGYQYVITDEGKKFITEESSSAIQSKLSDMWEAYAVDWEQFYTPVSKEQYVEAILAWHKRKYARDNRKRLQQNARRFLAEYYFAEKNLSFSDIDAEVASNSAALNALEKHFGAALVGKLKRKKKIFTLEIRSIYYQWQTSP